MQEGIPISILSRSKVLHHVLERYLDSIITNDSQIHIADFAAGENDEIPVYIHQYLSNHFSSRRRDFSFYVYCTDVHSLRIESLFDKLVSLHLEDRTRVVLSKFETMTEDATYPANQMDFVRGLKSRTVIDDSIVDSHKLPRGCFHIGILNNDVVGYIHEYYKEYTDASKSLQGIRSTMQDGGLLMVTQPCMLFPLDNIKVLESHGFRFTIGYDFDLKSDSMREIDRSLSFDELSKLGHYSILLFRCK